MCGIAGILGALTDSNRAALARMSAAMRHRGPDAAGTWESTPDERGWGVSLAHRRLSILDLTPAGAQPMVDPITGHVVAFNGEIYNYQDIRGRLVAAGEGFDSTGDTAVMLRALSTRGREALPWLRGMFAFALWNPERREILLARDPMGIKPLYVARAADPTGGWAIAFASEVRALLASALLGMPRLDPRAAASVVWNGFVVGPGTAVQGVDELWAGSSVTFDRRGAEIQAGDFRATPSEPREPAMDEEQLAEILREDVRLHLASDVPLAVFLSGGVDSSVVANLAQQVTGSPVHTFTLAFEEQELNEGPAARQIAKAIGTRHQEVVLTEGTFVAHLEDALDSLDQPTFDGMNSYFMSQAIQSAGFKVALAGTGGDELFGGYSSFRDLPVLHRWSGRMGWLPRNWLVQASRVATGAAHRPGGALGSQQRWAKFPDMVRQGNDLVALYQLAYSLFLPDFQRELLLESPQGEMVNGLPVAMHSRLQARTRARFPRSAISILEQGVFLGQRLLRDADVASMAVSLEQRVPLVDQVLFEAVDRLPDALRFDPIGKKAILRRIGLRGLDPALFDRPKSGFVLPFDRWLRKGLQPAMNDTLLDAGAVRSAGLRPDAVIRLWKAFLDGRSGIYWSRIWAVYALVRWCQRNRVYR